MTKTLSRHGNSQALVLDRAILDLLSIEDTTPLKITTDGTSLIITPVPDDESRRRRFEESVADTNKKYGKALKKLAAN
jgi:antitoxin component of MazEF toxin-antitoxin module